MNEEAILRYVDGRIKMALYKATTIDDIIIDLTERRDKFYVMIKADMANGTIQNARFRYLNMHNFCVDKRITDLRYMKKLISVFSKSQDCTKPLYWTNTKIFSLVQFKEKITSRKIVKELGTNLNMVVKEFD